MMRMDEREMEEVRRMYAFHGDHVYMAFSSLWFGLDRLRRYHLVERACEHREVEVSQAEYEALLYDYAGEVYADDYVEVRDGHYWHVDDIEGWRFVRSALEAQGVL